MVHAVISMLQTVIFYICDFELKSLPHVSVIVRLVEHLIDLLNNQMEIMLIGYLNTVC